MKLKITYNNYMKLKITRWLIDDYSGAFSNRLTPLFEARISKLLRFHPVSTCCNGQHCIGSTSPEPIYSNWTIQKCNCTILRHLPWGDRVTYRPSLKHEDMGMTPPKWNWLSPILWSTQHCATYIPHTSHDFSLELVSWDDHTYLDYAWFWSVFCRELRHWVEAQGMQVFGRGPTRANATAMTPGPCGSGPVTMLVLTLISLNT